jgi:malate synthase/allantoicase/CubicO group peptidase (beta-lactamase class C family)
MKPNIEKNDRFFEMPYYHDYISPKLARKLLEASEPVSGVTGLWHVGKMGGLENTASLKFLVDLYTAIKPELARVLRKRSEDRKFIDERVKACFEFNQKLGRDFSSPNYKTVIGLEDGDGRIVIGPKNQNYCSPGGAKVAPIPEHLKGPHVTLFGPPDSAKMSINAMNSVHRKLAGEPAIIESLLSAQTASPMWGADDEDSKTPLRTDLIDAAVNLTGCFEGRLTHTENGKRYELAPNKLAQPIKRFPGLALPCAFLYFEDSPIPLHLYDFALHLFANWHNEKALTFYVPKLENEEEARYIHKMISTAEGIIKEINPDYRLGSIRLMIVLENPRAILRTHEIIDELYPYFAGASLGWHDYLGSTARLFKEDANYRIPVKADPYIVIKYIKASHRMLADVVGSRGGIKVGGMYGILPQQNDITSPSFQVTLKGYFKDVITQLKRDLTGFWVAHPDFIRLGLAIVEAWRLCKAGDKKPLMTLTKEIFAEEHRKEVDAFIEGEDIKGLDVSDPNYVRSLLVADLKESDYIPNNHPDEIRYNVFQSLQYLTDWLSGNGCVALPTTIEGVPVRVMDDLATAERSRWEVWHEIYHGRFKVEDFLRIAHEEMRFIRKDLSDSKKIVQVKWDERTAKWYPVALKLMIQLMTAKKPVEFATELLLPFTVEEVRNADDPWAALMAIDGSNYQISDYIKRYDYYFERCGAKRFAAEMASSPVLDVARAECLVKSFSVDEIIEAAGFHGDIGEAPKTLDAMARSEQELATKDEAKLQDELRNLTSKYCDKFGFKFLISAKGKTAGELLAGLKGRFSNSRDEEINNAKEALWEITKKRLAASPLDRVLSEISDLLNKHQIQGVQIAVGTPDGHQTLALGHAVSNGAPVTHQTVFELASLSKTVATAFALDFFEKNQIALDDSVNDLLAKAKSTFRLISVSDPVWADQVQVRHLVSHCALNLHYVNGFPKDQEVPPMGEVLLNPGKYGYEPVAVIAKPGTKFSYSGAGFMVLEHLIEALSGKSIAVLTKDFLNKTGMSHTTLVPSADLPNAACGYFDDGKMVAGGRLHFPAFAAGAVGTAEDMLNFLRNLRIAVRDLAGAPGISHDAAIMMMHGRDKGCREFMGCDMGLGVFVAQMAENKVAIHQGANEGFRAIYLYVVAGPDVGKGFTILCNADNRGVLFNAEVSKVLIRHLGLRGVDYRKFGSSFDYKDLTQEQIVNLGYKTLVFDAFEKTMPEEIIETGPPDKLSEFNLLTDASVVAVSCERFARATNLFSRFEPIFDPELFGAQGKIMDSWETVRHNEADRDTLHLQLKKVSEASYVRISTKYHDGNHPQFVRVLGRSGSAADWIEIVPKISMDGHSVRRIRLAKVTPKISEVLVEQYPDGGLTRLGLFASLPNAEISQYLPIEDSKCERFSDGIPKVKKPLSIPYAPTATEIVENSSSVDQKEADYASAAFGAKVVGATNEHYGPAAQVISPLPPLNMFDGLESARSRVEGHFDEVTIKFEKMITPRKVILDFKYFVNNNPKAVEILLKTSGGWITVAGPNYVKPFAANQKEIILQKTIETDHIRIRTLPDGGINRVHVYE